MATINLGNLTFTHKGDYAGGTPYVKNDVVYYATNGNSYIAKTSTTGNAPTSTAHWDLFVAGSGGIWDGGLSLGSAGQVVKVNSGGSALEFGTLSSDYVKLGSGNVTSGGSFNIDGYFTNTYDVFKLFTWGRTAWHKIRFRFSDGTYTSGNYVWICDYGQRSSSSNANSASGSWNDSYGILSYWSGDNSDEYHHAETTFIRPWDSSGYAKNCSVQGWDYNSTEVHTYNNAVYLDANRYNEAMTGVHIFPTSGTLSDTSWLLYGIKA